MDHIILPGLTTTPGADWKKMIEDIDRLGIKQIAFFPTWLKLQEREKLYALLEKSSVDSIPHVHLRDDTEIWEIEYYIRQYQTEVFNIHCNPDTIHLLQSPYADKIYIETTGNINDLFVKSLDRCGGLCIDISHIEDKGCYATQEGWTKVPALMEKHPIGCAHISAVNNVVETNIDYVTQKEIINYSHHWLNDLSEVDYTSKYIEYLPKYVSIELENPFETQLRVKKHLEKICRNNYPA